MKKNMLKASRGKEKRKFLFFFTLSVIFFYLALKFIQTTFFAFVVVVWLQSFLRIIICFSLFFFFLGLSSNVGKLFGFTVYVLCSMAILDLTGGWT